MTKFETELMKLTFHDGGFQVMTPCCHEWFQLNLTPAGREWRVTSGPGVFIARDAAGPVFTGTLGCVECRHEFKLDDCDPNKKQTYQLEGLKQ